MTKPMTIIRPSRMEDIDSLVALAQKAPVGLTTLPADRNLLELRLRQSVEAFSKETNAPGDDHYLFVLEESRTGRVAGTSGLIAAVGIKEAFYSYKLGIVVHASRELNVYNKVATLYLSNDYTGSSELCTLFLDPDFRKDNNGKLLSKCRFLFMANFPNRFSTKVIAELRGYSDERGRSPFWEGLGRHFFSMDFSTADFLSGTGNKVFIAELMPKHPVYVNLLSKKTQEAIGKVQESAIPALSMLEKEGFSFQGYVDIFDAGPTVEAQLAYIRAIRASRLLTAHVGVKATGGKWQVVSNAKKEDFRCCISKLRVTNEDVVKIGPRLAELLAVKDGEQVRIVSLK